MLLHGHKPPRVRQAHRDGWVQVGRLIDGGALLLWGSGCGDAGNRPGGSPRLPPENPGLTPTNSDRKRSSSGRVCAAQCLLLTIDDKLGTATVGNKGSSVQIRPSRQGEIAGQEAGPIHRAGLSGVLGDHAGQVRHAVALLDRRSSLKRPAGIPAATATYAARSSASRPVVAVRPYHADHEGRVVRLRPSLAAGDEHPQGDH